MLVTSPTQLRVEDFPTEQSWIGRLFVQLNPYFASVNQVVNGFIDYSSNISAFTQSYTITSFQAFSFQWPTQFSNPPQDLRIMQASKGTQQTPTILLPAWSYDSSLKKVSIANILELTSSGPQALSGSYQFTLRATV